MEGRPSSAQRPGTAGQRPSTAGVHITEYPEGKSNPVPVAIDETEVLIEEYLSPRKLVSFDLTMFIHSFIVRVKYHSPKHAQKYVLQ